MTRGNQWLRDVPAPAPTAVLEIFCPASGGRLIGVVSAIPGHGLHLHRNDGVGTPLIAEHGPIVLRCRCSEAGHKLRPADVLASVAAGRHKVNVSGERPDGLDPVG